MTRALRDRIAAIAGAGLAIFVGACAIEAAPVGGAECAIKVNGSPTTVRYDFLSGDRFVEQGAGDGGRMTVTDSTITLGQNLDDPDRGYFSAITIDRATGAYSWTANDPDWTITAAGTCRVWGIAPR